MKTPILLAALAAMPFTISAVGEYDPTCVVSEWTDDLEATKIIDINFSDTSWPNTWLKEGSGIQCPEWSENGDLHGGYVNAVLKVETNNGVLYPISFHNCVFATKESNNGYAGATAAFSRQYYEGQGATNYNNWTNPRHSLYLEDNIRYNEKGVPVYGEAGFVQMCRNAAVDGESLHGWMEIDHIPYVEVLQWSWSSTSWGRGIKCDYKIGDGDWMPLVWMGSERQKQGWTVFSDQGYFIENEIKASDVSIRWRVWDGDDASSIVQYAPDGTPFPSSQNIDPNAQRQAPRVHKIKIYGSEITAEQAAYAEANPVGNVGELTDLSKFGFTGTDALPAPDDDAPVHLYVVDQNGSADFTTIQGAIDAVPAGARGIIYILPGVYDENLYAGTKEARDKFISLVGADRDAVILTSSVSRGGNNGMTYLDCAALNVFTDRFYAENLTIRNTSGNVGQAEALFTSGDAHLFRNVRLSGYQDTYKAGANARGYFTECLVEGATDFIYDSGLEWFENCRINCVKGGGYITAPGTSSMPMTKVMYPELEADNFYPGLFFSHCDITADPGVANAAYSLGRPWGERSGSMYLNSTLGSHISAAGWTAWGGAESTASLWEYNNTTAQGQAVDTSRRASFSRQAAESEVEAYANPEFLFANFSKVPFDYAAILNSAPAPANFVVVDGRISWDDTAEGYIVKKNGAFDSFISDPEILNPEAGASYSVQAVSRYGVTSPAVEAKEAVRMLAFPSAEGFGKYTSGGRGGEVVKVTSLADDGSEGTLRWAFNQHKGKPITIIFEVSGDIALNSELRVNRADWTLAGQSAPGEGIVITRNKVNLGGSSNFIIRNLRFRIGQRNVAGNIQAENALGAENCANFIIDHCSFGWSVEENMNTADSHFLTVQYCIVHEGLYNAGHSKGARGYGAQWGGSPATYHHNLLAHNNSRSPRLNGARGEDQVVFLEYINNVNYNYGKAGNCYGGENTADINEFNGLNSAHECNFMSNYYYPGPYSTKNSVCFINSSYARDGATSWGPAKWFVDGNFAKGLPAYTADNWLGVTAEHYSKDQIKADARITPALPYYKYTLAATIGNYVPQHFMLSNIRSAETAYDEVLASAGTVNRDKVEARVVSDALNGTVTFGGKTAGKWSGIIDTEADAEGFFAYSDQYTVPTDTDGDGLPDQWEEAHGLNPSVADSNRLNADGYTALEVYLNSLMGEAMDMDFQSGVELVVTSVAMSYDPAAKALLFGEQAIGSTLAIYDASGRLAAVMPVGAKAVSVDFLAQGLYVANISSPSIPARTLKFIRR